MKLTRAQSVESVRDEGCQTASQAVVSSTPNLRKRLRGTTVSPQDTVAKKPEVKRPKASTKEKKWLEIPTRKNLQEQTPKPEAKKRKWTRCSRPEAVLIKPAEGVSYSVILKDLKNRVKPNDLSVTVQGSELLISPSLFVMEKSQFHIQKLNLE